MSVCGDQLSAHADSFIRCDYIDGNRAQCLSPSFADIFRIPVSLYARNGHDSGNDFRIFAGYVLHLRDCSPDFDIYDSDHVRYHDA